MIHLCCFTGIHVEEDGFFALDDELFKEWHWSDCRIKNTQHYPCKEDYIDFGKKIGMNVNRVDKLLEPFLIKQKNVAGLVKKSFLDNDTKSQYLNHYNERLTMLNGIGAKYDQILSEALGHTTQKEEIMKQIISVVAKWRIHSNAIGILKKEQEMMQPAFKLR